MLGVLPGIIGSLQANEAIKLVLGIGDDARTAGCCCSTRSRRRSPRSKLRRDPNCPVCGEHPTITEYIDYVEFCQGTRSPRMTTVRIPPTLRDATGGEASVAADGDDGARPARGPRLRASPRSSGSTTAIAPYVNVYVDGEDIRVLDGLETPVDDAVDRDPPPGDGRRPV